MSNPLINGIGPSVKLVTGVVPLNREAGEVKGAAIDRRGFQSCVVKTTLGVLESNPSVYSVATKLQHSDTTTDGDFSDYNPSGSGSGVVGTVSVHSTSKRKSVPLNAAKQYIRTVLTVGTFTGGTTPKINCSAEVVLGGAIETPAQADD